MAVVLPDELIYVFITIYFIGKITTRFGGIRISYYRARGIPFFSYCINGEAGDRKLKTKRTKALVHHSPLAFEDDQGGLRFWPEDDKREDYIARYCGGAFIEYNWDDARPTPIRKHDGTLMDPQHIIKPFKNKSTTDLNRIGEPKSKAQSILILLTFFVFLALLANIYYTYFFGQNIACAVHSRGACP